MGYIVRTFELGCDEVECSTYENALSIAREVRKAGFLATIIDADAPKIRWHVTGTDVEPYDVLARSGEEALYKVQFATNDYVYDTAQVVGEIKVVVTRPDGIVDFIGCICIDEAKKYMRRYNARGWNAYIQIITTDCEG
nr:MAG TPA: hypothetical protein [Caudoviricetes sp.]